MSTPKGSIKSAYVKGSFINGTRRKIPSGNDLPDLEVKSLKQLIKEHPTLKKIFKKVTIKAPLPPRESRSLARRTTVELMAKERANEEAIKKAIQDEQRKAKADLAKARKEKKEAEQRLKEAKEREESDAAALKALEEANENERKAEEFNAAMDQLATSYSTLHIGAPFLSTGRSHPWQNRGKTVVKHGGRRTRRLKKKCD